MGCVVITTRPQSSAHQTQQIGTGAKPREITWPLALKPLVKAWQSLIISLQTALVSLRIGALLIPQLVLQTY